MAYNYNKYDDLRGFVDATRLYGQADDDDERRNYEDIAKTYYGRLADADRGLADRLRNSDYAQAQQIMNDEYGKATSGKTRVRDYVIGKLTGLYGMTPTEATAALRYNDQNGDMSLGGLNLGKPDAVVNDTAYVSDTSGLDDMIRRYAQDTGKTVSPTLMYNQGMQDSYNLWGQTLPDLANDKKQMQQLAMDYNSHVYEDPFSSEAAQNVIDSMDALGTKMAYGNLADGAGSNGGNIDSFAAANAATTQAAMRSGAYKIAQAMHNQQMQDALAGIDAYNTSTQTGNSEILRMLGGSLYDLNQQAHDNYWDDRDNQMDLWKREGEITGLTPLALDRRYNEFLTTDANGNTVIRPEFLEGNDGYGHDFSADIAAAEARGDNDMADIYRVARYYKYLADPEKFGGFVSDGNIKVPTPTKTEAAREFDQNDSTQRYAIDVDADTQKYVSDNALAATKDTNSANLATSQIAADTENHATDVGAQVTREKNLQDYDVNSRQLDLMSSSQSASNVTSGNASPNMTNWLAWANGENREFTLSEDGLKYVGGGDYDHQAGLIQAAANDPNLTQAEKQAIVSAFSSDVAQSALNGSGGQASGNQASVQKNVQDMEEKYQTMYRNMPGDNWSGDVKKFLRDVLRPKLIDPNYQLTEEELKNLIVDNSQKYDIEIKHAKVICETLGVDATWLDDYKNAGTSGGIRSRY